jgi:hypothetical protein
MTAPAAETRSRRLAGQLAGRLDADDEFSTLGYCATTCELAAEGVGWWAPAREQRELKARAERYREMQTARLAGAAAQRRAIERRVME